MLKSQKPLTISRLFLRTLCICLFSFFILGLFLIWKDYAALSKDRIGQEVSILAQATGTYHSTLMAMLLNEDHENMARFLKQITKQEKLLSVDIIASPNDFQKIFSDCNFKPAEIDSLYQIPSCAKVRGGSIEVFQEIQSFGTGIGFLHKRKSLAIIQYFNLKYYLGGFLLWFGCVLFFILFYTQQLKHYLIKPLEYLSQNAPQVLTENLPLESKLAELETLAKELGKAHTSLQGYKIQEIEVEAKEKLIETAVRVAHDIRSPLSSMQTALEYLGQLKIKEDEADDILNLLHLSSKRLTGIADDLLKKYKGDADGGVQETFSLHQVLDELIGEYQGQDQYHDVCFIKSYTPQAIQICGDRTKLQRAFGNIIKNASEAMMFRGEIVVGIEIKDQGVAIFTKDNGPGISPEKLQKIMAGGFTEGKQDGHGIGMKVVQEAVSDQQGKFWVESKEGEGATFFIQLPLSAVKESPESFELRIGSRDPVVIIDDDPSVREQWKILLRQQGLKSILCASYEEFETQKISTQLTKTAIVDYHFDNSKKDGLEIIQRLKDKGFENFTLCTAEYWKPSLQRSAKSLEIALCPKPLPRIEVCPVEHKTSLSADSKTKTRSNSGYKVLVIDDDQGIRLSWELIQKKLAIEELKCFANWEELQQCSVSVGNFDIAFVDKNIDGSKFSGVEVISQLKKQGIPKVVLASGESVENLRGDPQYAAADFIINEKIPSSFEKFFS